MPSYFLFCLCEATVWLGTRSMLKIYKLSLLGEVSHKFICPQIGYSPGIVITLVGSHPMLVTTGGVDIRDWEA